VSLTVVSNTSPIVNLAAIGQLELLRGVFGSIIIPDAVYHEIVVQGAGRAGSSEIPAAEWIVQRSVNNLHVADILKQELGAGEAEALALALEIGADWILLDERLGRRWAARLGLPFTGLLGVLAKAKARSLIPAVKPLMDALRTHAGFWISPSLYQYILASVGEHTP